jgi:HPt (histidine-containing phosphotransfer) domain-containing protein
MNPMYRQQDLSRGYNPENGKARAMAPIASEKSGLWDHATALWTVGNDVDFLIELVRQFLAACPRALAAITTSLADGELKLVEDGARSMKDSLRDLAAKPACETASRLEQAARQGDLAGAKAACQNLERALSELSPVLVRIGEQLTRGEF